MKGDYSKSAAVMEPAETPDFTALDPAPALPGGYTWEAPGKPVVVRIDYDVVDRLLREVQRGFGLVPRRGVEMGGILIGSCEPVPGRNSEWLVHVVDFEGIPCSHSKGMAYQLSGEEEQRFDEVVSRWKRSDGRPAYAVGLYRSHTREGLGLASEDVEMFNRWFPEPGAISLLVKPFATRASVGAIFFRENGSMRTETSYLEFPFRRADLGGGDQEPLPGLTDGVDAALAPEPKSGPAPAAVAEPASGFLGLGTEPAEPPPVAPSEPKGRFGRRGKSTSGSAKTDAAAPPPEGPERAEKRSGDGPLTSFGIPGARRDPVTGKRVKTGWVWIPLSFIFLLLGVVVGFQGGLGLRSGAATSAGDPIVLGLTATPAGESLDVRWDGSSLAVQGAARGTLTINDGGLEKVVSLDRNLLRNASVAYPRSVNEIRFVLEVFARERTSVTESVTVRPLTVSQPVPLPGQEK